MELLWEYFKDDLALITKRDLVIKLCEYCETSWCSTLDNESTSENKEEAKNDHVKLQNENCYF